MAEPPKDSIEKKIEERLRYYEDLGMRLFYRDRKATLPSHGPVPSPLPSAGTPSLAEVQDVRAQAGEAPRRVQREPVMAPAAPTLFDSVERVANDTLLKIRQEIGECTRCKLHRGRNKIVFGDGNPKAELVFVGEGPGAEEDLQGLPFVGRAGKLLTQMIEAMGLERKDVYICNVVKCRPPENRAPEPDEVATCSPFLVRQMDVLQPKVIVCLGAVAAKTVLNTTRGISQFRGEWLEWRGHKVIATYHPAYLLRNPGAKGEVWRDLQKVMAALGLPLPRRKSS